MSATTLTLEDRGKTIQFLSKNPYDTVSWRGTVKAVGVDYAVASGYGQNLVAYNVSVQREYSTTPAADQLTYFLFQPSAGVTDDTRLRPFALEWIVDNSLVKIDPATSILVEILNPPSDAAARALVALRSIGLEAIIKA